MRVTVLVYTLKGGLAMSATSETRSQRPAILPAPDGIVANPDLQKSLKNRRLDFVQELLVGGTSRSDVVAFAMGEWSLSRRSAQVYVQIAWRRIARDAGRVNRVCNYQLSRLQCDRLLERILSCAAKV